MELIDQVMKQFGIEEGQAKGGMGLLLKLAKEQLGSSEFSQVEQAIPESDEMLGAAPDVNLKQKQSGGVMSMIFGLLKQFTGKDMGQLSVLIEGFKKLDLPPELIGKFAPMLLEWVKTNAGQQVFDLLYKALFRK